MSKSSETMLSWAPNISAKKARALILDLARYGALNDIPADAPDENIMAWFTRNGYKEHSLIEATRIGQSIPLVENLIGPDWTTSGDAGGIFQVGVENPLTGERSMVDAPATVSMSTYHSQFDAAARSLNRAIETSSYQDALQALASGFAALEAFVNERIKIWNATNPSQQLLDPPPYKTFDDKVADWFPIMMRGHVYDKGRSDWSKLKQLRELRDKTGIHPQAASYAVSARQIADIANGYRLGITTTLFNLHRFFETRVPHSIIRAMYAPDVIVN